MIPSEDQLDAIPLARAGEFELNEREIKQTRQMVYRKNRDGRSLLSDYQARQIPDGMEDSMTRTERADFAENLFKQLLEQVESVDPDVDLILCYLVPNTAPIVVATINPQGVNHFFDWHRQHVVSADVHYTDFTKKLH